MYETYWKLKQRPFESGPATDFYFPAPAHQASLLKLRYLIEQNKGVGLLVGEHGLGKSFLLKVLEKENLTEKVGPFIKLTLPVLEPVETLRYLALRAGAQIPSNATTDVVLICLEARLKEMQSRNEHPVFIIDDAHLLTPEQLSLLQLLQNRHEEGEAQFSMILAGRVDLLAKVKRIKPLDQRISVRMALKALDEEQVENYIAHRMEIAGVTSLFNEHACQTVYELSQGIPRRINQICDLSLLVGYVDQLSEITRLEIETAADEILCVSA